MKGNCKQHMIKHMPNHSCITTCVTQHCMRNSSTIVHNAAFSPSCSTYAKYLSFLSQICDTDWVTSSLKNDKNIQASLNECEVCDIILLNTCSHCCNQKFHTLRNCEYYKHIHNSREAQNFPVLARMPA